MILYHGSPNKFEVLRKNQTESRDGVVVPKEELQDTIYLSIDYPFALAMCSMPRGLTNVDYDNMTIKTEFPEDFDPNKKIYIYTVNSDSLPKEKLEFLSDGKQVAVHVDDLHYETIKELPAGEVLKYYKLLNYENPERMKNRIKSNFKLH
jgi:hypothetical protein